MEGSLLPFLFFSVLVEYPIYTQKDQFSDKVPKINGLALPAQMEPDKLN